MTNKSKTFIGKVKKVLKGVNLLDGQRRGEIIFRRAFVLIVGFALLYLILLATVGKKQEQNVEEVEAVEVVVKDKEEWINGDRVTTKPDGSIEIVPAEMFMDAVDLEKERKIETYLRVNRGNAPLSKYARTFVEVANKYELDYRLLPAIAVMESSGGKSNFKPYNAWGWGRSTFASFEEGIEAVGKGIKTGYYDKGRNTVELIAPVYCPPNYRAWISGVNQFMSEIEAL